MMKHDECEDEWKVGEPEKREILAHIRPLVKRTMR